MDKEKVEERNIENAIEAILFVAGEAMKISEIAGALEESEATVSLAADRMIEARQKNESGIELVRLGDKLQLSTSKLYEPYIKKLFMPDNTYTITQAAIETLSIIAYNQPVTRSEIEKIRGVSCTYSLGALLAKGLICEAGKKDTLGHPLLYATTDEFLRHFDLRGLQDLPELKSAEQE